MTPEQVLGALVVHSANIVSGTPDPLHIQARDNKIGKSEPLNWRLMTACGDKIERLELWPRLESAHGRQTRHSSKYSIAEVAADALIGMYDRNWHTLQVAIGIGGSVRPLLFNRLLRIAYRTQKRERIWPEKIKRRPCDCGHRPSEDYVPDLVELAVRHLEQPAIFLTTRARYQWFGLGESHWHAVMARPYDQVAAHIWAWYFAGIGHIQHRIRQRGHRVD